MIEKDTINRFIQTEINRAKEKKTNDNFFTRNPSEIIPEYMHELNLNFNNEIIPETATKVFRT